MRFQFIQRVSGKLNRFFDSKFNNYRGEISTDIAKAVAVLAVIVAIWTMTVLFLVFAGITIGLMIGHFAGSNLLGFSIIAAFQLILALVVILFRKPLVERPVYLILNAALRGEDYLKPEVLLEAKEEEEKIIKKEKAAK